ncbi:flagellar basal body-associated FliL family protein [Mesorhizobium sp. RMAD-H1]|uniref:flagellar basal body-associated FliL family protein n=1 Tax=Mesorhizobium sp. RMAD-H1 TaxID=2587065 RepID=UPI00160E32CD|nr:flagellar basal body-associated FliL family protein [Mesorhizobium sp. RMAD-H1]MBB2973804.1 flagellar FliL protein [Mesorhizobium sp. RMAD-H1]
MSDATNSRGETEKRGGSLVGTIAAVAILTVVAAGGGWFLGGYISGVEQAPGEAAVAAASEKKGQAQPLGEVVALKPILTNLAVPSTTWIRLESALVAKPGEEIAPEVAMNISDDFMAFLRSANLMQLQGATGLAYLRADLEERARMRSEGKVERVFISSLVVE